MSIRGKFPEQRPTLNLDFANSKKLDPRITFSRTTTSTCVDENGLIVTTGADEPRFDHDPTTGESLGLLIEEQRKNQVTYSEDFTQWNNTNTTDAVDTSINAPDGTNTATKITDDSTNAAHNVKFNFTTDSSDTFTVSCFVKKGDFSYFVMILRMVASSDAFAKFDFDNPSNNTTFGGGTNRSQTVTEYPNGWYRISFTSTFGAAVTSVIPHIHLTDSGGNTGYSGSGNFNYIWGAQLEIGEFPTSYIPTSGSTKTRSADNYSMTGTNFSDWYNTTEGTIFLDCTPVYSSPTNQYKRLLSIHNNSGSQTDVIQFIQAEQANNVSCAVWDGSSFQAGFSKDNTSGTRFKVAFAVKENNMNASYDGNIGTDDTTCTLPAMTEMDIGSYNNALNAQTVHINNISYYPKRLTNTQLQNLTK